MTAADDTPKPLQLYITGATGFLGSQVVRAAKARGHDVVAVVRPASPPDQLGDVVEARVDLRSPAGLAESLAGVDSVIHLAAAKSGDFPSQFAGTVVATENLLTAMATAGIDQLVGISTFSVYDYRAMDSGSLLDEHSPLDTTPAGRDEYARTKLVQEQLYREFAAGDGTATRRCVILRPGMIYGANNLWHALLGAEFGPRFLRIGSRATLPMTYVENCAEAIVLAAERLADPEPAVDGEVINIVDDDLPTQAHYAEQVASRTDVPPSVTVPWPVIRTGAEALAVVNRTLLSGRAKFPGIAVPDRLYARFKPLRYTNDKAKSLLGWSPRYGLVEAIERSLDVTPADAASSTTEQAGTTDQPA